MVEIAQCPECEQDLLLFEDVRSGQYVRCNHCGTDLEIVDAGTMEMDWLTDRFLTGTVGRNSICFWTLGGKDRCEYGMTPNKTTWMTGKTSVGIESV